MLPNCFLQVLVRELHNRFVSYRNDVGIKDSRDEENTIIISDSTLRTLLPPQLKKCQHDKRSGVDVNVAFMLKLYMHLFYPGVIGI